MKACAASLFPISKMVNRAPTVVGRGVYGSPYSSMGRRPWGRDASNALVVLFHAVLTKVANGSHVIFLTFPVQLVLILGRSKCTKAKTASRGEQSHGTANEYMPFPFS
jgi:hypothetical protein